MEIAYRVFCELSENLGLANDGYNERFTAIVLCQENGQGFGTFGLLRVRMFARSDELGCKGHHIIEHEF